ncbi:cytochrome P450 [Streptomyces sp. NPDC018059]|uniref:cytochrome P450 n=1 Tax=Streptomyces sp. NPDC018059 TaxID=3365041 RepID=UPI003799EAE7
MSADGSSPRSFPFTPVERLEEEALFAALREREPICRVRLPYGGPAWLVTRYDDVRTVLSDPRFSRAATAHPDAPRLQPAPASEGLLMSLDPPEHTRPRRAVARAFTVRGAEALRPATEAIAASLLDGMASAGAPADLVRCFALPLPVRVICTLLGVPEADQPQLLRWSDALLTTADGGERAVAAATGELTEYLLALVERRRSEPSDDLLGELVRGHDAGDGRLREDEMVALARDLLVAGHETTAAQIADFTYVLLHHPGHWDELCARPELMASAVEELLRYVPLGSGAFRSRIATEEVELCGVRVRPGEAVFAPTVSANRDPRVFEAPARLDLGRRRNAHLAFGFGPHHCLGAQLARMELRVAMSALVARFPGLRLAADEAGIEWRTGLQVRGPRRLPVRW